MSSQALVAVNGEPAKCQVFSQVAAITAQAARAARLQWSTAGHHWAAQVSLSEPSPSPPPHPSAYPEGFCVWVQFSLISGLFLLLLALLL